MLIVSGIARNPQIRDEMRLIEAQLAGHLDQAAEALQTLRPQDPKDAQLVHGHIADLHRMLANLAENEAERQRRQLLPDRVA